MTQAFDYSKDTGKTVYANVNARLIAQLATVAAIAKLATFLLWFLVMLAPALDVIGNFAFLLFGAIAIVKLTQSGAAFVTKSAIPFITQPPAAFDDDASKGVEVSLPA